MSSSQQRRLLIVSNRLPMSVVRQGRELEFLRSVGGLATGLASVYRDYGAQWIGWPGLAEEDLDEGQLARVEEELDRENCHPVLMSGEQMDDFYHGFCNKTIWPLFHYFPEYTVYNDHSWQAYRAVNGLFAEAVLKLARPDDIIWIHDYQLMLLPELIRRELPEASVAFFLHIPFPSFEIFRLMPWRQDILLGMLGADLIGFHTYDYVGGFLESVRRILGFEHSLGRIKVERRLVQADAFPMGIDYQRFSRAVEHPEVVKEVEDILAEAEGRDIILSIDRLDYSKGLIQRLEAFERFLELQSPSAKKVTLILLVVPSRTEVDQYAIIKKQVDELVGKINGRYGSIGFVPIWYLYRSLDFHPLVALYRVAKVGLVTPIRDGMNLVAKEFVATKREGLGTLILSEMAGAAQELGEAIIVNPNNKEKVAQAIKRALEMPEEEQRERMTKMQERIRRYDINAWARDFLERLDQIKTIQRDYAVRRLTPEHRDEILASYRAAQRRLFLFDYDGTLVSFADRPEEAVPDEDLQDMLARLAAEPRNEVVIVSNRDRPAMTVWFGHTDMGLVAEHGFWVRERGGEWELTQPVNSEWKKDVRPILEHYVDRTPRSFVEEKDYSLVWHFRMADPRLGEDRAKELKDTLLAMTTNLGVEIQEGNKIIMVKFAGANKGRSAVRWLAKEKWDFILSAGDDFTDEDMFAALPAEAYSLRVGLNVSRARYNLASPLEVRSLVRALAG